MGLVPANPRRLRGATAGSDFQAVGVWRRLPNAARWPSALHCWRRGFHWRPPTTTISGQIQHHHPPRPSSVAPPALPRPGSCASIDATIARLAGFFSRHPQPATKRVFNRAARSQTMTRVSIYSSALVAFVAGTSALSRPSPMTSSPPGLRHGSRPSRCPPPAGLAPARAETRKHALQASG